MKHTRRCSHTSSEQEQAATTLEYSALAGAIAVLAVATTTALGSAGLGLGGMVGDRLRQAASIPSGASTRAPARPHRDSPPSRAPLPDGLEAWWQQHVAGGDTGSGSTRWGSSSLHPVLDPIAAWSGTRRQERHAGPFSFGVEGEACVACVAVEGARSMDVNGTSNAGPGVDLSGELEARVELAAAEAGAYGEARHAPLDALVGGSAHGRVGIGAQAQANADATLTPDRQAAELSAGAMVGATAAGRGAIGVELLGVAIRQSGQAEGWAGAGAHGTAALDRRPDGVAWTLAWGAALGLGGAGRWSGSVDVSGVPEGHRQLARGVFTTLLHNAVLLPGPGLRPMP